MTLLYAIDIVKAKDTGNCYLQDIYGDYFAGFYENDSQWADENHAIPFATEELATAQRLLLMDPRSKMR